MPETTGHTRPAAPEPDSTSGVHRWCFTELASRVDTAVTEIGLNVTEINLSIRSWGPEVSIHGPLGRYSPEEGTALLRGLGVDVDSEGKVRAKHHPNLTEPARSWSEIEGRTRDGITVTTYTKYQGGTEFPALRPDGQS